ncbi:hypothetical protein CRENPOLYSF1_580018 [Crenothrix polyspora]|uniref:Uncharacterized protein n=1 Tax=Crenothrix polyspora TaxID=360316 RepID=A0A1R4HER6_9GAMM|nr:hypothetical protein CRENPOLYSF1_580018 [Crenothrix polyspora]
MVSPQPGFAKSNCAMNDLNVRPAKLLQDERLSPAHYLSYV